MQTLAIIQALTLLAVANTIPVIATKLLGAHFAWPLDAGFTFIDRRPLFGQSKTLRGLVLSIVGTAAVAPFIGLQAKTGALVAAVALSGDLMSSFVKRRLNLPSGGRATGLDQLPEALLPLLVLSRILDLTLVEIVVATVIFFVGEVLLSQLFYRLHLRDRPY